MMALIVPANYIPEEELAARCKLAQLVFSLAQEAKPCPCRDK